MSAFSRGLGARLLAVRWHLCQQHSLQLFAHGRRTLKSLTYLRQPVAAPAAPSTSTTNPKAITAQPRTGAVPKPQPAAAAGTSKIPPTTYAWIQAFNKKGEPALLYESASHAWMKASAWTATIFCYGMAGINYYTMLAYPPEGIAFWIPWVYTGVCLVTAGMGSYFLLGTSGIIKSIRALPVAAASVARGTAVAGTAAAAGGAATPRTPSVLLEFQIKRVLPFVKPKTITVPPEKVSVQSQIYKPVVYLSEMQLKAARRQKAAESKAQWEYDRKRLMTLPFRHAGRGVKAAYAGVARALTREGFVRMKVDGTKYKLDITSGWALEDGRALDRLIKVDGGKR